MAPIALFVYNRPWHTRQVVEALRRCELASESDLFVFADGPKKDISEEGKKHIEEVRQYIHSIDGFRQVTIVESPQNVGCAGSIVRGVSQVVEKYGKVIVVEDDIVAHPFFLRFMNDALETYEEDSRIFCVSATMENFTVPPAYTLDVFLTYRIGSWGWATWEDRWVSNNWDIDTYPIFQHPTKKRIEQFCRGGDDLWPMLQAQQRGDIDSWAIRFCYNMSLKEKFCLRPIRSFVNNIGMDNSGVHCRDTVVPLLPLYDRENYSMDLQCDIGLSEAVTKNIHDVFRQERPQRPSLAKRIKRKAKGILRKLHLWK